MKTLSEIIEEVKSGGGPDYDDLRYALVAMCALRHFDHRAIETLRKAKLENKKPFLVNDPEWAFEESWKRFKAALGKPPKEWCGPSHDPDSPEYQRFRRAGLKLIEKITADLKTNPLPNHENNH